MRELLPDTFSRQAAYRVKIYLAAILLLLVKTGLGQGFESAMGRISYRDGIEGHNPHASMISSDGKLWIYTEKQLNCYDGYRVRAFLDEDPPVVARLNNLLFEAPDGTIWAGSYMLERKARVDLCGNLTIKVVTPDGRQQDFQDHYQNSLPFSSNDIINICSDGRPGSSIYICTQKGKVYRYDKSGFHEVPMPLSGQLINTVYPDTDGSFWIGSSGRLSRVSPDGQVTATYPVPVSPLRIVKAGPQVYALIFWPEIGYRGKLVRQLLLLPGQGIQTHLTVNKETKVDITNAICIKWQEEEGIWHIVSTDDWRVFDKTASQPFSFKKAYPEEARGFLVNNLPQELYFDQAGVAYASMYSKILALKVFKLPFRKLLTEEEELYSMRAILSYRADTVLLSSYSGLAGYNPITEEIFWIRKAEDEVWLDAIKLSADTLLASNHSSRIKLCNRSGDAFQIIPQATPDRSFLTIYTLFESPSGQIWLGTSAGLAAYQKGSDHYRFCTDINTTGALERSSVRHITEHNNRLWLATDKGLYSLNTETRTVEHHFEADTTISINYLYWASPDTCWMATNGSGLWRWTPSSQFIKKYNRNSTVLPNDVHHAVYPDRSGRLWVPSNDGLIWLMPSTGEFGSFTRQSGLPDNEFNYNSHLQLDDGRLVLGGVAGVVVFHPDSILVDQKRDASLNVVYFGVPDKETGLLTDRTAEWAQTQQIELSTLTNMACHLKVHVASYLPLEDHQYDYRIDGQHDNWIPMSSNELVISGLPYGEYQLRIRGRTNTYAHNSEELRIPLFVQKPYYEKWYFWLLIALGTTGIGFLVFRFRLRQLRHSEKRLRQEVERRTQTINQDRQTILRQNTELEQLNKGKDKVMSIIGHEIKGNLFFIGSATRQILQTIRAEDYDSAEALSRNIHHAALRMEGAIENLTRWATLQSGKMVIQRDKVRLRPLLERLIREQQPVAERKGIELSLDISGDPTALADFNAMNICLQNLLRNALKFTDQSGSIRVSCFTRDQRACLEVKDSGIGMEQEIINRVFSSTLQESRVGTSGEVGTGLGLNITKELIGLQSGELAFESKTGQGTTVIVTLPLYEEES
ncbi:ATP-binding protein [Phaeodactylibacter xiamenensis]|uniref:sensor histidine kinase n=1 Tax=Phaeodactylibacter xiamenensis TaxID=1524460 RepID=UPI003CCB886D